MEIKKMDLNDIKDDLFYDAFYNKQPVILTGVIETWELYNFTVNKFNELYGDKIAPVRGSDSEGFSNYMEVEVNEYIKHMNSNPDKWYCDFPTDYEEFPNLSKMYTKPNVFQSNTTPYNKSQLHEWLYLGGKGTGTPFHVDVENSHAWNALIFGEKEWHLLDVDADYNNINDISKGIKYIQKPNELLYIPPKMPHKVTNTKNSLCITGNFWDNKRR